jgi:hypothetical protein
MMARAVNLGVLTSSLIYPMDASKEARLKALTEESAALLYEETDPEAVKGHSPKKWTLPMSRNPGECSLFLGMLNINPSRFIKHPLILNPLKYPYYDTASNHQ